MASDRIRVHVNVTGPFWFTGWLFTIAYAQLAMPQAIFAVIVWPWYLGIAVR